VEERIQKAQQEGVFDNLSGKGKPLNLDDDSTIPEDLRLVFKVLKNTHCLPVCESKSSISGNYLLLQSIRKAGASCTET